MVKHRYRHKPLGVLKIPLKMISAHRPVDAWYLLAPASDMLQKTHLGQIRVELRLKHQREIERSTRVPFFLEATQSAKWISGVQQKVPWSPRDTTDGGRSMKNTPFALGREASFVKITILEGRSLIVADFITSDPFVEIILLDKDKERDTNLKTDIKMRTLNPKWENQEFLLGKSEKTMLSDKTAVMLRVMDYDRTSANDPLGCVTIEFQRSDSDYIRGLVLKQATTDGSLDEQELRLDDLNRAEVEAMLLPAAGQANPEKHLPTMDSLGNCAFWLKLCATKTTWIQM